MNNQSFGNLIRPWLAAVLIAVGSAVPAADSSTLLAGVGRVDLTPPLSMKAALGGYGARDSKPAIGVHDAVWAKAVMLTQGERKFVLVTADVLAFPYQFKAAVMQRLSADGWNANRSCSCPATLIRASI